MRNKIPKRNYILRSFSAVHGTKPAWGCLGVKRWDGVKCPERGHSCNILLLVLFLIDICLIKHLLNYLFNLLLIDIVNIEKVAIKNGKYKIKIEK